MNTDNNKRRGSVEIALRTQARRDLGRRPWSSHAKRLGRLISLIYWLLKVVDFLANSGLSL